MTTEMATPESSDSSAATTTTAPKPEDIAEAVNQLVQGKRHMLVQDYVSAVSSLEKACKLFAESYGETANECGEPYLFYGKALLELSRMETGVLGHALQGVESEEDEDEEEAESEDKDSKDSDDQVENPDNVTGDESGEERDLIVKQVGEALLENACELEKKMAEMKGEKSVSSETNGPTSEATKDETESMDLVSTSDEIQDSVKTKDIPTKPKEFLKESKEAESLSSKDDEKLKGSHSKDNEKHQVPKSTDDTKVKKDEKSETNEETDVSPSKDKGETKMEEVSQSDTVKTDKEVTKDAAPEKTDKDIIMDTTPDKSDSNVAKDITTREKDDKDVDKATTSMEEANKEVDKDIPTMEKTDNDVAKDLATTEKDDKDVAKDIPSTKETNKEVAKDITNTEKNAKDVAKAIPTSEKTTTEVAKDITTAEKDKDVAKDISTIEKANKQVATDTTEKTDIDVPKDSVEKPEDGSKDTSEKIEKEVKDLVTSAVKTDKDHAAENSTEKMEVSQDSDDKLGDSESVVDEKTEEELLRDIEEEKKTEKTEDVPNSGADDKKAEEATIPKDAKSEFKVPSSDSIPESSKSPSNEAESPKEKADAKEKCSETKMETEVPKEKSSSEIVPANMTQSSDKPSEEKTKLKASENDIETEEPMETDLESKTKDEDKDENDEDEDGDESESIDEKSQDETTADDAEAGPSNSTEVEKEKDDEVTNLQLAWEVLELAKVIFDRQGEKDEKMKLKSAEVLHKLGEVSIESENYTQAIEDLNSCLDIQKKILTTDDRTIAETYYQLGLAFSLDNQFDNSVEHFTNAIRVLEERIANCRELIERGKPETKEGSGEGDAMMEDPLETAKRELEELEALIPDIKTKIEDTEDMKKTTTEAMKEEALSRLQKENSSGDTGAISNSPQASPSKPTKDVSHLVKRKRKPEDDLVSDSKEEIKKVKSDNDGDQITTNGNAVNGDQKMEVTVEIEAS